MLLYVELRQLDLAIADETKAIELDPNRASAYSNRASAREADNQLELAIAHSSSGAFVALADDDSISGSAHVNNIALDIVGAPLRGTVALVVTAFGLDKSARGNRSSASTLSVCVPERIVTTTTSNSCNDFSHWLRDSQNAGFFVADSPTGKRGDLNHFAPHAISADGSLLLLGQQIRPIVLLRSQLPCGAVGAIDQDRERLWLGAGWAPAALTVDLRCLRPFRNRRTSLRQARNSL